MLSKVFRLRKNHHFSYVYRKGASVSTKNLVMIYAKRRGGINIGFSVSNKLGKAVKRNKIKRRLRGASKELLPKFQQGYSYVFVARNDISVNSYKEILGAMNYMLDKMKQKQDKQ